MMDQNRYEFMFGKNEEAPVENNKREHMIYEFVIKNGPELADANLEQGIKYATRLYLMGELMVRGYLREDAVKYGNINKHVAIEVLEEMLAEHELNKDTAFEEYIWVFDIDKAEPVEGIVRFIIEMIYLVCEFDIPDTCIIESIKETFSNLFRPLIFDEMEMIDYIADMYIKSQEFVKEFKRDGGEDPMDRLISYAFRDACIKKVSCTEE